MTDSYTVSRLAKFFHSFPHVDLTFTTNNGTFDLDNDNYIESLGLWVAVPIVWCLLNILFFICYFCYRCCSQSSVKPRKITCLKWTVITITLFLICVLGIGFYGNIDTKRGMDKFTGATEDVDNNIQNIHSQLQELNNNLNITMNSGLREFEPYFKDIPSNTLDQIKPAIKELQYNSREVQTKISKLNKDYRNVDIHKAVETADTFEKYRWQVTLVLMIWEMLVAIVLIVGMAKEIKSVLILCTVFLMINLVISWILAGVLLGFAIGVGDFCVDPDNVTEHMLVTDAKLDKAIVDYYLNCPANAENPYGNSLTKAQETLLHATETLENVLNLMSNHIQPKEFYPIKVKLQRSLTSANDNLIKIITYIDCTPTKKDYIKALNGLCYNGLDGVAMLLISMLVAGVVYTVLVLVSPRAWRFMGKRELEYTQFEAGQHTEDNQQCFYIRPSAGSIEVKLGDSDPFLNLDETDSDHRRAYDQVDEQDPFLPPDDTNPHSNTYYRYGSLTGGTMRCEPPPSYQQSSQDQVEGRSTPPPTAHGHMNSSRHSGMNPSSSSDGSMSHEIDVSPNAPLIESQHNVSAPRKHLGSVDHCFKCGSREHPTDICSLPSQLSIDIPSSDGMCGVCHSPTHDSLNCPSKDLSCVDEIDAEPVHNVFGAHERNVLVLSNEISCSRCGSTHQINKCPETLPMSCFRCDATVHPMGRCPRSAHPSAPPGSDTSTLSDHPYDSNANITSSVNAKRSMSEHSDGPPPLESPRPSTSASNNSDPQGHPSDVSMRSHSRSSGTSSSGVFLHDPPGELGDSTSVHCISDSGHSEETTSDVGRYPSTISYEEGIALVVGDDNCRGIETLLCDEYALGWDIKLLFEPQLKIEEVPEIINRDAKIAENIRCIVIHAGLWNVLEDKEPSDTFMKFKACVNELRERFPLAELAFSQILPHRDNDSINYRIIDHIHESIEKYCDLNDMMFIDHSFYWWKNMQPKHGLYRDQHDGGGIYINDMGKIVLSVKLNECLLELYNNQLAKSRSRLSLVDKSYSTSPTPLWSEKDHGSAKWKHGKLDNGKLRNGSVEDMGSDSFDLD